MAKSMQSKGQDILGNRIALSFGPVRPTQYSGLKTQRRGNGWRILASDGYTSDPDLTPQVGMAYPSYADLMRDLDRFAKEYGY
jgi:hypothetical protein